MCRALGQSGNQNAANVCSLKKVLSTNSCASHIPIGSCSHAHGNDSMRGTKIYQQKARSTGIITMSLTYVKIRGCLSRRYTPRFPNFCSVSDLSSMISQSGVKGAPVHPCLSSMYPCPDYRWTKTETEMPFCLCTTRCSYTISRQCDVSIKNKECRLLQCRGSYLHIWLWQTTTTFCLPVCETHS